MKKYVREGKKPEKNKVKGINKDQRFDIFEASKSGTKKPKKEIRKRKGPPMISKELRNQMLRDLHKSTKKG